MSGTAHSGKIKFFDGGRGYGFIVADDGLELFFHITEFAENSDDPSTGDHVSFAIGKSRDGKPRALNVKPI
jgi:cold shock CspA family protein